jgi:hypothetical protein
LHFLFLHSADYTTRVKATIALWSRLDLIQSFRTDTIDIEEAHTEPAGRGGDE